MTEGTRYDGHAEFYEDFVGRHGAGIVGLATDTACALIGEGSGRCLDIGCGNGRLLPRLAALGWEPVGIDESEDQLRVAAERAPGIELVRGDAAAMPFGDASFDAAVSLLTHTDIGDFAAAIRDLQRVLKPGGRFVYVGNHPCFVGPTARHTTSGIPELSDGYRRSGWWDRDAASVTEGGLRHTLGTFAHWPLGEYLDAFAGLRLDAAAEPDDGDPYPKLLALSFTRL